MKRPVQEAIEEYRAAADNLLRVIDESNAAVRAYHASAIAEMEALARGEKADLTDSARAAIRLYEGGQNEREAHKRVEAAKVRALRAIVEKP